MRVLIATAVEVEADAVRKGLPSGSAIEVAAVGVGPANAAAGTARRLTLAEAAGAPYDGVISMGIAGGFADVVGLGGLVVATRSIAADLGAQSPEGYLSIDELGFGRAVSEVDPALHALLRGRLRDAVSGDVLTVSTVTGIAGRAQELRLRYPHAAAEAMEGAGVAAAATACGVAYAEIRAISNAIGPRDRAAWQIGAALQALTSAAATIGDSLEAL
ncbi:MAG: futalosine hydrolase [Hamadaea sp.]|nr:futalosine hydrolase [Hamadaea sp.]